MKKMIMMGIMMASYYVHAMEHVKQPVHHKKCTQYNKAVGARRRKKGSDNFFSADLSNGLANRLVLRYRQGSGYQLKGLVDDNGQCVWKPGSPLDGVAGVEQLSPPSMEQFLAAKKVVEKKDADGWSRRVEFTPLHSKAAGAKRRKKKMGKFLSADLSHGLSRLVLRYRYGFGYQLKGLVDDNGQCVWKPGSPLGGVAGVELLSSSSMEQLLAAKKVAEKKDVDGWSRRVSFTPPPGACVCSFPNNSVNQSNKKLSFDLDSGEADSGLFAPQHQDAAQSDQRASDFARSNGGYQGFNPPCFGPGYQSAMPLAVASPKPGTPVLFPGQQGGFGPGSVF